MSRSKWKGPYINIIKNKKVHRSCEITPSFLEQTFLVHDGKSFNEVIVTEDMIGHKFGEFSFTRNKFFFKKKKSKK